jgi:transposase-like protein
MEPNSAVPDPEVPGKATRRRFTSAERARLVEEFERLSSPLEKAAFFRREKIYSSLLYNWRAQLNSGSIEFRKRGPKPNPQALEYSQLKQRNEILEQRLAKAEQVIDVQGKVYALLRACAGESADHLELLPWQKSSKK